MIINNFGISPLDRIDNKQLISPYNNQKQNWLNGNFDIDKIYKF